MSAIFHALRDNNLSLLKEQLDKGEDVNKQDASDKNMTILHKACIKCNLVAVKLILKYKPVINTKDRSGCSPLLDSCVVGDLDLVGLLLDNGAHINVVDDYRRTPLYWATREDDFELVKLLLSKGADPNIVTLGNWSPLHEARSSEVVKLLVQFGANINYTDAHDDSPLTEASSFGRLSVVQSLCQLGADVNHRGKWGQTALQRATDLNHIPTVKFLLAQQPDLSIVNNSNQTVLQLAREKRNKEIEDLISTYIEKTQIEGDCQCFIIYRFQLLELYLQNCRIKPISLGFELGKFHPVFPPKILYKIDYQKYFTKVQSTQQSNQQVLHA